MTGIVGWSPWWDVMAVVGVSLTVWAFWGLTVRR